MSKNITVKELIEKKDYDYISWRLTVPEHLGGGDTFFGATKSVGGTLIPLDGDIYDENEEVLRYEEWSNPDENVVNGLTVVCEGYWLSK